MPASPSGMDAMHSESVNNGGIALELMLHSEVHSLKEEWSGVTNPAADASFKINSINVHIVSLSSLTDPNVHR